jgi:hypothetical protein
MLSLSGMLNMNAMKNDNWGDRNGKGAMAGSDKKASWKTTNMMSVDGLFEEAFLCCVTFPCTVS